MQTISKLPVFTGTIPNKATQTDTDFANNIFGFLNYNGSYFVGGINTIVNQLNILSDEINTAASQTETNAKNVVNATATLATGSIDDVVISATKAYSNQKVNALFSNREDKLGANIASAASITIGTAGLGDTIHITGTTTITSLGVASVIGTRRTLIFDSALTLTHNGTFLICPGSANIVTMAGTVVEVVADNLTVWRVLCVSHPSLSFAKLGYLSSITSDLQTQLGYLSSITSDLQTQLNTKAPLASPAFTGSPTAPTPTAGDNSTKIATTAFVLANSNAVTSTTVGTANAGIAVGGIGSYALLYDTTRIARTQNTTVAGSALRYANAYTASGSTTAPAGAWRLMGCTFDVGAADSSYVSLWLRIA